VADKRRRIDSDALSLGELFCRPVTYLVPVYQRDFAWTLDEVDALWEDLTRAIAEGRSEYFLGAVIVSEDPEKKCEASYRYASGSACPYSGMYRSCNLDRKPHCYYGSP
jgi:hypothetical protein